MSKFLSLWIKSARRLAFWHAAPTRCWRTACRQSPWSPRYLYCRTFSTVRSLMDRWLRWTPYTQSTRQDDCSRHRVITAGEGHDHRIVITKLYNVPPIKSWTSSHVDFFLFLRVHQYKERRRLQEVLCSFQGETFWCFVTKILFLFNAFFTNCVDLLSLSSLTMCVAKHHRVLRGFTENKEGGVLSKETTRKECSNFFHLVTDSYVSC